MVFSMLRTCQAMASLHVYEFDNKPLAMLGQCWTLQNSQTIVARPVHVFTSHFRPPGQDQHQRICSRLGSGSGFCFGLRFGDAGGVWLFRTQPANSWQAQPACTIHTPSCSNRSAFKHATPATLQLASKKHIILDTLLSHAAKPWKTAKIPAKNHYLAPSTTTNRKKKKNL